MSGFDVSYPGALLAGVLSFASPCILPLVPAYLSFLAGVSFEEIADERRDPAIARRVVLSSLAFVAGFVTVFVVLGASASVVSRVLVDHLGLLAKVAGVVVILFGLHYTGLLPLRLLSYDLRFRPVRASGGAGAFLMGLAFAFGWTPCVGPVLATILTLAAAQTSIWRGVALLTCYGIGIGLPFVAAAAAVGPFMRLAAGMRSRMRWVEVALGGMMIATGSLILVGSVANVSGWLMRTFPALSRVG
ncbi:MAG TPA: cytochrome c biogenesis protein CcdA [Candidatus Dormibacteraeota bacterium]|nr:cytochrome c biogenesis protein CcdA [Candidatus Dormibacteraeota bacterium]